MVSGADDIYALLHDTGEIDGVVLRGVAGDGARAVLRDARRMREGVRADDRAHACAGACADAGERLVLDGVGRDAGLGGRALLRLVVLLVAEEVEGVLHASRA